MSKENGYNGYSNWDTWNASLWLNNDEGLYWEANRMSSICSERERLGRSLRQLCEDLGVKGDGFDYNEVDWAEVADTFLEE